MDMISTRGKASGPSTKMHYEIGAYNRSGEWTVLIVSGDLFETYREAVEAADRQSEVLLRAMRRQDALKASGQPSGWAPSQGGAA